MIDFLYLFSTICRKCYKFTYALIDFSSLNLFLTLKLPIIMMNSSLYPYISINSASHILVFCVRNTHIENYYVFLKNWHLYHNEMLLFIHDNFPCFEFFFFFCLKLKQRPHFLLIKASVDLFPFIF